MSAYQERIQFFFRGKHYENFLAKRAAARVGDLFWKIIQIYTVSPKLSHLMFDNNFDKHRPIFKILSPGDSSGNSLCTYHKDFHLTCGVLLRYLVNVGNPNM